MFPPLFLYNVPKGDRKTDNTESFFAKIESFFTRKTVVILCFLWYNVHV